MDGQREGMYPRANAESTLIYYTTFTGAFGHTAVSTAGCPAHYESCLINWRQVTLIGE
jgi:hypothetical protein